MAEVNIDKDISGRIIVSFLYDPALQSKLPSHVIASLPVGRQGAIATKQSQGIPSLAKRGEGRFSDRNLPSTNFDDLKRELLSRKYSYNENIRTMCYYHPIFWSKMALGAIVNELGAHCRYRR